MAIMRHSIIFGGVDSANYGIYISGEGVFNAPRRDVEMTVIPGRNGALALDHGRYENISVTYPAFNYEPDYDTFAQNLSDFRNAICSQVSYQRLEDTFHPGEYRMAAYTDGLEVDPIKYNTASQFDLTFNCKPQRFLTSGEEPVDTSELGGEVTTNRDPYLFRHSGGGNIGHDFDAEIDKIIGGTVAWNQLCNSSSVTIPSGHKYYMVKGGSRSIGASSGTAITGLTSGTDIVCDLTALFGSAEIADYVYSLEQTTAGAGVAWLRNHGFIDGSYRAYDSGSLQSVKTSEHRTVGFNQWDEEWELGYYNHSTGAKETASDRIRSKNKIPVIPNASYCVTKPLNKPVSRIIYYDANGTFLRSADVIITGNDYTVITIPTDVYFINFNVGSTYGTTYNHDICINISKTTGSPKNGDYVAYDGHSYPLDSDLELRGKFKLDANNNLYTEGDVYPPSGEVARKYKQVTFDGSEDENWMIGSSGGHYRGYITISDIKSYSGAYNVPSQLYICSAFTNGTWNNVFDGTAVAGMTGQNWGFGLDALSITDATGLKSWLSSHPIELVYELATPTTEQADPYANPQVVNLLGTEEYIDTRDVPVPVGHETKYGMSQLVLTNPTEFPSKPLLEVTGVGTFWLGDTLFTITGTAGQTIYIDCETGEAWKNTGGIITPANGLVTLNRLDFPELDPGDTPVMYGTGITKVVVTPRWWII